MWKMQYESSGRSTTWLRAARLLLLAFLLIGTATSRAASFTASLERDTLTLGETTTLSLKFEDGAPKDAPSPPGIANLQIAYVGPSSQFSFINGRTTSSVTHNYIVTPRQAGEFTIPALTADVGGRKLTTQPLKLKVLKPGAPPPEAINSGSQLAFMKLVLPKKEVYVGETITAELQLYFRDVVQAIGSFQLNPLLADGMTVSGKFTQGQERRVQIGSSVYRMVPLAITLSAVKTGTINIGPVTASVVIQIPGNSRRRDPFFEQFGIRDPFNDGGEQKQVLLATDAEAVHLLPLPGENVPANFNGAVGSYEMTVTAGPTNVAAGDPITVRVQIAGRGALDSVTLPEQTAWHDFKIYPPTSKVETSDQFGLQGTKTFEQIVVPQSTDIRELPAFSFSFFNPDEKAYHTLTHPAVRLAVRPGGATPMPVIAAGNSARQENSPPVRQDIVPIKQRLETVAQVSTPLVMQPWFLGAQAVPALAFFAAFVWRKRTDSLANNPRLRRQRLVAQIIRDGTGDLRRLASEKKSDEFFATLFRLLQEQLGERLDCPASSITEAVIDEKLRPRGVEETTLASLHELFQMCNLARYAPIKSSQELAAIVPKFEKVLNELREVKV
jgi:BatD DUF11 like domain